MYSINEFKQKYFNDWAISVPKTIELKTNNKILARQGSDLVLNFSPMVNIFYQIIHFVSSMADVVNNIYFSY